MSLVTAPSVFTLDDLRRWGQTSTPLSPPPRLAVLGDPVAHSASPPMHSAALQACGIPTSYIRLHIRPSELAEAIPLLQIHHFLGVNLTIPHKAAVLPLVDHLDPSAQRLGVANTLAFRPNGITAYNTDGGGLVRAIQDDFGVPLGSLHALILGAGGGAGRAIAIQCLLEHCPSLTLVNRTHAKAEALALELRSLASQLNLPQRPSIQAIPWNAPELQDATHKADLLLQCSSLGMQEGDPSPIPADFLQPHHRVYDTIYSRPTQLLLDAQTTGAHGANGLSMLLHQGALAFEIWFPDHTAPVDLMKRALLESRSH